MAVEQYFSIVFLDEELESGECWFGDLVFKLEECGIGGIGSVAAVLALLCGVECELGVEEELAYI